MSRRQGIHKSRDLKINLILIEFDLIKSRRSSQSSLHSVDSIVSYKWKKKFRLPVIGLIQSIKDNKFL